VEGRGRDENADRRDGLERDGFQVLRESPMLGDGKYKLEIGTGQARFIPLLTLEAILLSADTA